MLSLYPIREGEKGAGAVWVGSRLFSRFARVHARMGFLIWGEKAHGEARGPTFLPFYSAEIGFLSEKRSQVAQPQRETRILIENINQVAQPPCQTFHSLKKETLWRNLPATIFIRHIEIQHNVI